MLYKKDAFTSFHNNMNKVSKFMKPIRIGKVLPEADTNVNEDRKVKKIHI